MKKFKEAGRVIRWAILILFLILLYKIFVPVNYRLQSDDPEMNYSFWRLSTGSVICYTHLPSSLKNRQTCPVIYLHGGPGGAISQRVIDDLKPLCNDGFDLYFYDQVGSGRSGRLSNISEYTVQRHVDDLDEIINTIGKEKVILIGQSWGALLAASYLSEHHEKIEKVIFTSPGPIYPRNKMQISITAPDSLQLRAPLYTNKQANESATNLRIKAITFFATRFGIKIASDKEADQYAKLLDSKTYKSALCDTSITLANRGQSGFFAGVMTYKSLFETEDYRGAIKGLKIPVLIMKGQCDNQPWGATEEYLKLFPVHKFVYVREAGHFINVEQYDSYIREIRNFLLKQ